MHIDAYFENFSRRDWETDDPAGVVRVAIIGVGEFARTRALPALQTTHYCSPTVLVSRSQDCPAVADEYDIDHILDYEAYLDGRAADAYDAVYISTPNALHAEYAISAARRGKHVLCEKPLAATVADSRAIVDACRDAGVTLMTAYRLQLEPTVRRTREMIADGVIGDVVQFHAGFSHPLMHYSGEDDWRLDQDLAGGGALVDLGIYPLNAIRFLLDTDPIAISATTHSVGDVFASVDEHVAFQIEFPNAVTASCTASFNAHPSSGLQALGSSGKISISSPFGGVVPHDIFVESGDIGMEYRGPPIDEVSEEFAYFGYCVLTGTRPEPNGQDGLDDMIAIDAAYESAARGERVEIPALTTAPGR